MQSNAALAETTNVIDSEVAALVSVLKENDRITNEEWQRTLTDRKRKELEFHDKHRDRSKEMAQAEAGGDAQGAQDTYEKFYGNKKYYSGTIRSRSYVEQWLKDNTKDKVFLDYACGNGTSAIKAARWGSKLSVGIDISPISIQNARSDAERNGVSANTFFLQADCENTRLPDNSIDVILCSGMLHHLDLSYAFPELRRILKPGGKLLAVEALDYNPAIKAYRLMTPEMRTDWEKAHILSYSDLRFAKRFFDVKNINHWHIFGILTPHVPEKFASVLVKLDQLIEKIPLMKMMSWIFTFELHKRKEA